MKGTSSRTIEAHALVPPGRGGGVFWRHRWVALGGATAMGVIVFLLLWELILNVLHVPRYVLPPPSAIFRQFQRHFSLIWRYTLVTEAEVLVGYAVAIALGVPLAAFIAFSKFLERTLYPSTVALEMVPKIAFAPLFVTWFGFSFLPKIIIVMLITFFPIILNGILAFRSLIPELFYFSRSTGAGPWMMFWKVRAPAALPQLFVGLKIAATNAAVGAVIAEWIGGDAGLGYYLQISAGNMWTDLSFGIIVLLSVLGLALYYAVSVAERKLIPWHVSQRVLQARS